MTGILFTGSKTDPNDLRSVIGQALGAASMCWGDMSSTGVFDHERASALVDEVVDWIEAHYAPTQEHLIAVEGRHKRA